MPEWYLNGALTNFRREVNTLWPNRDRTSDGTIGDAAHKLTNSDHNADPDGSVDAWDMDVDGVDVWACIEAALKHESIQYVIYNRRITSRTWGLGVWRSYDGKNPHDKHVHFNTRPEFENSDKPWFKEREMNLTDKINLVTDKAVKYSSPTTTVEGVLASTSYYTLVVRNEVLALRAQVTKLAEKVDSHLATGGVSPGLVDAIAEAVAAKLAARLEE